MKKFKRVMAVVAALALTAGMTVNCMAKDTWGSYFGREEGAGHGIWYEGAEGTLKSQSADGWTAEIKEIGWGGIWGGQVYQNTKDGFGSVDVKKGTQYKINLTLKSSKCDKWVFIKIATKEDIAYGKWIRLKKGQNQTLSETFTAACDANSVYFGIGGEFGDRGDETAAYSYADGGQNAIAKETDEDALLATVITCTGFSLVENSGSTAETPTASNSGSTTTTPTTVSTGDFEPYAFGMVAILAAAAVVVFSKKREQA